MRAILNHIDLPALIVDGGSVRFANPAAQSLLGSHIISQDMRIAFRQPEAIVLLTSGNGGRARISGLSVKGSIWEMACHALDDGAQLVTLQDLSVQSSVARAHSDFVANASHELRTPLASILGYVEALEDPKAGEDAETRSRFLGVIAQEAQRMHALVEDLMSLSRIEAVKHDVPEHQVEMVSLASNCVAELRDANRVSVTSNVEKAIVSGDAGQLSQALRNLITNALKYGKADGQVEVMLELAESGWLSVTVSDQGEGIPPEHLPRLTERFYRVDAGRSKQAGGTGLGLAIVKHIIERHRGRFDISSRVGEGTKATIILPPSPSNFSG